MKTLTQQAVKSIDIQPLPELTRAAVELFGNPMSLACGVPLTWALPHEDKISMELGVYDVLGAHYAGPPPSFGKYANCHFDRRCLGCERDCSGEGVLVDLAISRARPMLLGLFGGPIIHPSWLRVIVIDPGKRWSGGVFIPGSFRHPRGVVLEPENGGTCLVATAEGLSMTEARPGEPWLVAGYDCTQPSFWLSLSRNPHPAIKISGQLHAFGRQGA